MSIIFAAILGVCITLPMVFKLESWLNHNDDFDQVKEWHNFQTKMRNK